MPAFTPQAPATPVDFALSASRALDIITGMNPFADRHFQLALLAGPLTWLLLWPWLAPQHFNPAWPWAYPQVLLLAVLIYPPLEEVVFRGWLQQTLAHHIPPQPRWCLSPANLATSLVFALAHLWRHSPLMAASVLLPSLIFGYFRERQQSLLSPILLHSWYNLGFVYLFANTN